MERSGLLTLTMLVLATAAAAAVLPGPYTDGSAESAEDGDLDMAANTGQSPVLLLPPAGKRRDDSARWIMGLGKRESTRYTPYISVGVLSNMQQFFDNLRTNLETIESMPKEEREALLGQTPTVTDQDREIRPKATAAYLHALRNHRPSYKIRNFVAEAETRGSHGNYDPGYMWTGLGRKR